MRPAMSQRCASETSCPSSHSPVTACTPCSESRSRVEAKYDSRSDPEASSGCAACAAGASRTAKPIGASRPRIRARIESTRLEPAHAEVRVPERLVDAEALELVERPVPGLVVGHLPAHRHEAPGFLRLHVE